MDHPVMYLGRWGGLERTAMERMDPERGKGQFINDVSREGEGGGYPNSDTVKKVA